MSLMGNGGIVYVKLDPGAVVGVVGRSRESETHQSTHWFSSPVPSIPVPKWILHS